MAFCFVHKFQVVVFWRSFCDGFCFCAHNYIQKLLFCAHLFATAFVFVHPFHVLVLPVRTFYGGFCFCAGISSVSRLCAHLLRLLFFVLAFQIIVVSCFVHTFQVVVVFVHTFYGVFVCARYSGDGRFCARLLR